MGCVFENCNAFIEGDVPEIFYIPEKLNGEPVEIIKECAFYGCRGIKQVVIPDTVKIIENYAFAECRDLKKMVFPESIETIGDYVFYNCMSLGEIVLQGAVDSIGYGAFKNCLELKKISLSIFPEKKISLNSILLDEFQEIDVELSYKDISGQETAKAKLVFTDYQYEYVPEIEARQFNWETYGSGDSYRISIGDTDIDYNKYDSVFPVAVVEDSMETLLKIVCGRLCWPYRLLQEGRTRYESYLKTHMNDVLDRIIASRSLQDGTMLLEYIIQKKLMNPEQEEYALMLAQRYEQPQITALLMNEAKQEHKNSPKRPSARSRFAL